MITKADSFASPYFPHPYPFIPSLAAKMSQIVTMDEECAKCSPKRGDGSEEYAILDSCLF